MSYYWDDGTFLYHHGIAGQKWGIRNGPPYPLDYQYHSNREIRREYQDVFYKKRLDKRAKNESQSHNTKPNERKRSIKEKVSDALHSKAFKIGVAVTAAALTAYGAYKITHNVSTKLGQRYMQKRYMVLSRLKGQNNVTNTMARNYVEDKYLNQLISSSRNSDAYKRSVELLSNPQITNPNLDQQFKLMYGSSENVYRDLMNSSGSQLDSKALKKLLLNNNPQYGFSKDTTSNCRMCTTSLLMRLKGYNTSAGLSHTGWSDGVITKVWNGAKVDKLTANTYEEWYKSILKYGEGHYGDLSLSWKQGGGHSVLWLNKGGKVHIIDGQSGHEYALEELASRIHLNKTRLADITNCTANSSIMGMVMDNGSRSMTKLKIHNVKNVRRRLDAAKVLRENRKKAFEYYKKQWGDTMSDAEIRRRIKQILS